VTGLSLAPHVRAQEGSVILPEGSIDSVDIFDEAGAAQTLHPFASVTTAGAVMVESTINAASSGYVLALVSGQFAAIDNNMLPLLVNELRYGLSSNCAAPNLNETALRRQPFGGSGSFIFEHPIATQHLFQVTPGPKTICLIARVVGAGLVAFDIRSMTLTLIFIPTAYGTVDQL